MNVKRFVCCLLASVLLLGVSLISCGNSSRAKAKNEIAQSGEDFKSFLDKFTSLSLIHIYCTSGEITEKRESINRVSPGTPIQRPM